MAVEEGAFWLGTRLDMGLDEAIDRVSAALQTEGFGVLTEIDVQATLKEKLGVDMERYRILGACNPHIAHRALSRERPIGLLLPCNVVVHEDGDGTRVLFLDPVAQFGVSQLPELAPFAQEARDKLRQAAQHLEA